MLNRSSYRFMLLVIAGLFLFSTPTSALEFNLDQIKQAIPKPIDKETRAQNREAEIKKNSDRFSWWPTEATPAPVQDEKRGGQWWWPKDPGGKEDQAWGNQGYIYMYRIIYDYKGLAEKEVEEVKKAPEPVQVVTPPPPRPSLIIRKIRRNVKIYFDYNKADLRNDHLPILEKAVRLLKKHSESSILITGNCDTRGSSEYNIKLGEARADIVKEYMLDKDIPEERIKIISQGKLNAVAPVTDLLGMQKDRNAQFMVADVEEFNVPADKIPQEASLVESSKHEEKTYAIEVEEKLESTPQVSTEEYTIQEDDSLWKIAKEKLGKGNRWEYLYEINKDRIKNPNKLKAGTVILIPVE